MLGFTAMSRMVHFLHLETSALLLILGQNVVLAESLRGQVQTLALTQEGATGSRYEQIEKVSFKILGRDGGMSHTNADFSPTFSGVLPLRGQQLFLRGIRPQNERTLYHMGSNPVLQHGPMLTLVIVLRGEFYRVLYIHSISTSIYLRLCFRHPRLVLDFCDNTSTSATLNPVFINCDCGFRHLRRYFQHISTSINNWHSLPSVFFERLGAYMPAKSCCLYTKTYLVRGSFSQPGTRQHQSFMQCCFPTRPPSSTEPRRSTPESPLTQSP